MLLHIDEFLSTFDYVYILGLEPLLIHNGVESISITQKAFKTVTDFTGKLIASVDIIQKKLI